MDIKDLLKTKKCACKMEHSCDIKEVVIEHGATKKIGELAHKYQSIVIAADVNTYAVCADYVKEQILDKTEAVQIFKRDGLLIPDEIAIDELSEKITDKTDLIIGIGSGVIQDLCKYVSFEKKASILHCGNSTVYGRLCI